MRQPKIRREKKPFWERAKSAIKAASKKRDKEYSKRMLTKIIDHSLWMMWGTYVLAWFGKIEIAESLSKTIATSIIAIVVGYLAKSVLENISKNTTAFGENVTPIVPPLCDDEDENDDDEHNMHNLNRDC